MEVWQRRAPGDARQRVLPTIRKLTPCSDPFGIRSFWQIGGTTRAAVSGEYAGGMALRLN